MITRTGIIPESTGSGWKRALINTLQMFSLLAGKGSGNDFLLLYPELLASPSGR
jgi:hypothetical protein